MTSTHRPDFSFEVTVSTDQWGRETVQITGIGECSDEYRKYVLRKAAQAIRTAARALETLVQCRSCTYRPSKPGGLCRPSGKCPRNYNIERVCEHWQSRDVVVVFNPKRRKTTPMRGPRSAA